MGDQYDKMAIEYWKGLVDGEQDDIDVLADLLRKNWKDAYRMGKIDGRVIGERQRDRDGDAD